MADATTLLERFKPLLRYDSNEAYFADSAAEMTDAEGNLLRSASGETIATAGAGEPALSLDFLAAVGGRYPNGAPVSEDDVLSVQGRDYLEQYRRIRPKPAESRYANVVYGRACEQDGVVWLQYWLWFFYNDLRALGHGLGLHEGDWEGIELRLEGEVPDLAVYAQHGYAETREWTKVETRETRPVVYVSQGSHASYFDDGLPLTHWQPTEHFVDRADGKISPKGDVELRVISDPAPAWVMWPGRWGDTEKPKAGPEPYRAISSGSPTGPGAKGHWNEPASLLEKAREVGRAPGVAPPKPALAPAPPARPQLAARQEDGRIRLDYAVAPAAGEQRPSHLLVTVNSPDDPYPPTTYKLELEAERGTVDVPIAADPGHRYELRASGLATDGAISASVVAEAAPE